MRRCLLLLPALLAAGLIASCTENKNPSTSSSGKTRRLVPADMIEQPAPLGSEAPAPGQPPVFGSPSTPKPSSSSLVTTDMPDAPADAQWTLYCQTIAGPGHVERSRDLKAALVRGTPLRDWYVIHGADSSNLYHGFYRAIDSSERSEHRRDGTRAQSDRQKIDGMLDANGGRPFKRCMFVELAAPDPDAPPEWNLAHAPQEMFWSVQIAAYGHHPDRKKFAVESVREARNQGVEAYYYHGPAFSSVCVGLWPMDAVRHDGSRGMSDHANRDLLILPAGLPPIEDGTEFRNDRGERMHAMKNEVEIVDRSLIATLKKYSGDLGHTINGELRISKGQKKPDPSFLVRVPGRFLQGENVGDFVGGADAVPVDPSDTGISFLRPRHLRDPEENPRHYIPRPLPGRGRLRSLEN